MINLEELLLRIDTNGADVRLASTLQHLKELLGAPPRIDVDDLPKLPDRLKKHLESKAMPDRERLPRDAKYKLNSLLKLAAEQGLIRDRDLRFDTGFPHLPRPGKKGPEQRRHDAYRAFELWCSGQRIAFDSLSVESFVRYREVLKAADLSPTRREALYLDLRRFWEEKAAVGLLPPFEIPRWKDNSRENYGLARNLWPAGCIVEFEAFERGARNQAREGERRWHGPLRKVSVDDMEKELRQFLGYLRNVLAALPDDTTLLNMLSDREAVIGFVDWHIQERCGGEARGYHENTLKQLSAFLEWLGGDEVTVGYYKRIANTLIPVRVRDPFPERPMDYDDFVRGAMQALQEKKEEFENAKTMQERIWAACRFRDALILALLVCRPIRSRNVREMGLGENLYQDKDTWRMRFLAHQAKARQYICDFPSQLVPWLEFYLAEVRPVLLGRRNTNALFITKSGRAITAPDLWRRLCAVGEEYLGISTNPHLFRYLIPSAYLARHPDALDQMQAILGHSTMQTTIRCYVHTYSQIASRKVAAAIREHCPNLTRLAALYPQKA